MGDYTGERNSDRALMDKVAKMKKEDGCPVCGYGSPCPNARCNNLQQAQNDIGILVAQIEWLSECTGETLEDEDLALFTQIKVARSALAQKEGEK